jgi:uncharacterized protein (TIGR03084 family)
LGLPWAHLVCEDAGMDAICTDLAAEHAALDAIVAPLDDAAWDTPTPAPGWTIRDQIGHLWFFDGTAVLAATDAEAFKRSTEAILSGEPDAILAQPRAMTPPELLAEWRQGRARMLEVFRSLDPSARVPWYGPPMAARSFATARLMETWAHGQDVADTLGVQRPPTARLKHVAHIGVRARPFAYATNGRQVPEGEVFVDLVAPGGEHWTWNDPASPDRVSGDALEFCLVVTQRRHPADTKLVIEGPLASEWMGIAQAFAGPPGAGREPGQFS